MTLNLQRLVLNGFLALLCFVSWTQGLQIDPNVIIVALLPEGIRVTVSNVTGLKCVSFYGVVNYDYEIGGRGSMENDKWTHIDMNVPLKPGDTIDYNLHLESFDRGSHYTYDKHDYAFLVESRESCRGTCTESEQRFSECSESITLTHAQSTYKGATLFEDDFSTFDRNKWLVEERLSDEQRESSFVSYQSMAVSVDRGKVKITPQLLSNYITGFENRIKTGVLDLTEKCTSMFTEQCQMQAEGANILPPVISGRLSSKESFSFKYGRIDVRARLPQGDWIYPELYLVPSRSSYGHQGFESGLIRIAFARGNRDLSSNDDNFNNNVLSGGILLDQMCRSEGIVMHSNKSAPWGGKFHTYSVIWEPDKLTYLADGKIYGEIIPPDSGFANLLKSSSCLGNAGGRRWRTGSPMAPFDKEFHIEMGLGVGGTAEFPDDVGNKPWHNQDPKAKSDFWKQRNTWYSTWQSKRSILIDSVRVTAV